MSSDQIQCTSSTQECDISYCVASVRCQCSACKSQFVVTTDMLSELVECPWCKCIVKHKGFVDEDQI